MSTFPPGSDATTDDLIEQFLKKYPLFDRGNVNGFNFNNWTGLITPRYFGENGNFVTFSPVPEEISPIAGLLIVAFLKKMMDTEKGREQVTDIIEAYLKSLTAILTELHKSSVANPYICLFNNYVAVNIYKRLGLISPLDALQCRAWIDHEVGESLLSTRIGIFGETVSTLVQSAQAEAPGKDIAPAKGLLALLGGLPK